MDNHPIPQDVTGFQFRLIGDMTIKQFAYLAAGVILAWISLSLPILLFVKLPLILFFGGLGVLLAFIPLGGRPADTMILYFFKAVFSPTVYQYKKNASVQTVGQQTTPLPVPQKQEKDTVVVSSPSQSASAAFDQLFATTPIQQNHIPVVAPLPSSPEPERLPEPVEQPKETELEKKADELTSALQEAKKEEQEDKGSSKEEIAHEKVETLESQLQTILEQKQQLEKQLLELQQKLSQKPPEPVFNPSVAKPPVTENVRKVPPTLSKTIGAPFISDVPNLISGIVKDSRGNVLPNVLIEVKDKDNNPVRAFKTNPLGQFASATPVINGVYTLTFEDPNGKQRFDSVELPATGEVMQPLEVISVDAREDLRKELFGG